MDAFLGRKYLGKIRLVFSIIRAFVLLIGNPKRTSEILRLGSAMHRLGLYDPVIERLKSDPRVSEMFEKRFIRGWLDLDALSRLPKGTLGHEFVAFVRKNGIDPNYFHREKFKIKDDHDYYEVRVRETHDIWHVVLGFDAEEPGEISVQGFMISQFAPPLSAFLVGGAFLRVLVQFPTNLFVYTEALTKGFQIGANCSQFMAEKWEECWEENLDSLRKRLNVPSATI
jgi:ubiquinone biosynthesis protein COQ4